MNIEYVFLFVAILFLLLIIAAVPIWPWNRKPLQNWIAYGYYGMGKIALGKMTRKRAIEYVTKNFGVVMFVDDDSGFIFYKPRSEIPS